jgi:P pilus assembly chaperone PapD
MERIFSRRPHWAIHRLLRAGALAAVVLATASGAQAAPGDNWNIDPNVLTLDPGNRFVGNVVAINRSNSPVFVRATVTRVELGPDGQRRRAPADSGTLRVYPSEFALKPNEAFTVRLIANPALMSTKAESFYVKMVDVGEVGFSGAPPNAGAMAVLLGFEALVAVNRERATRELPAAAFPVVAEGDKVKLTNDSQRHIYLLEGYGCPNTSTFVVDCEKVAEFPRQSLLPGESVLLSAPATAFVTIALQPDLNATASRQVLYLPRPAAAR